MAEILMCLLILAGGTCFTFGIVYPLIAILIYPIYKYMGGEKSFMEYVKGL